jgi:hypothetical protein
MTTEQFLTLLQSEVPELAPTVREHLADNDELLPHVLMGDVTRFALATRDGDVLRRLCAAFEAGLATDSDDVGELLSVSFLENLDPDDDRATRLEAHFGPQLKAEQRQLHHS